MNFIRLFTAQVFSRNAGVPPFQSKHSAEQYVYLKAERLEHLFKQGYSRNSSQSIRIIYRDIGLVDSAMQPDEKQPKLLPPLSEVIPFPA